MNHICLHFSALIMTTAREITKDIEDMEGDMAEGAKTFPILYGPKISAIIAISLIIIDCALCPLLYIYHIFNINYLIVVSIAVLIFLYGAALLRNQDSKTANKVSKILKNRNANCIYCICYWNIYNNFLKNKL